MPEYKLSYLPIRYLAEPARLIFHYAQEEFEDEQLGFDEWDSVKQTSPFNTLPLLTINGKIQIGQSMTIFRYLAKQFGLDGGTDLEDAHINCIAEYFREMMEKARPFVRFWNRGIVEKNFEQNDEEPEFPLVVQQLKLYLEPAVREYFPVIIDLLKKSKNDFFADSGITWVDFFISEYVDSLKNVAPELAEQYPELLEHSKIVHSIPQLQNYLESRKHTDW
uniref:glutathione transferase n=1 Tax=Panagrolaimus davidi TaxID=227884 RepID=A0A914PPM7_9BILA